MARACRHWALLLAAILLHPAASLAALDPTDVIQIHATTSLIRDNNLFRLPDVDPRLFGIDPANKADTARVLGVGLKFDKLVSRQRLIADVNLNETVYDKNDNLDFFGGDGRLAWLWQVGNYWSGEASVRKRRTLAGFDDLQRRIQDLVDTDTYSLTGGYQFHPRWRASVELSDTESTHNAATRSSLDVEAKVIGGEIRYTSPKQSSIGFQARRTDRNYPNRVVIGATTVNNKHEEIRLSTLASWQMTSTSKIDAGIGHVDVQHERLSVRDFSGITWRAGATWDTTSKLRLGLRTSKDIRLYEDISTSYIVVHEVGFDPTYAITPKIIVQGAFAYAKREFRGDPGFIITNIDREDKLRTGRIGIIYSPIRNVDLSLSYETGERKANRLLNSFDYQTWFGTVRIGF